MRQGTANAATHFDGSKDKSSVSVVWTPPQEISGRSVAFVATVVAGNDPVRGSKWYEGISSQTVDIV